MGVLFVCTARAHRAPHQTPVSSGFRTESLLVTPADTTMRKMMKAHRKPAWSVLKGCLVVILLGRPVSCDAGTDRTETGQTVDPSPTIDRSTLGNLTLPTPADYNHPLQFHFPQPAPLYALDPLLPPTPTPTRTPLDRANQAQIPARRQLYRRNNDGPSYPGTDTVYATKTVFISQPAPAATVFVSNGQIVNSPQQTPAYAPNANNNGPSSWTTPGSNPRVVVATVTAYSSAKKFVWDGVWSSPFLVLANLVHIGVLVGVGLVDLRL